MGEDNFQVGAFEGVAGRVLAGAMSLQALFTGMVVVGFLKAAGFGLDSLGQGGYMAYVGIPFVSFLLVRFAMNGRAGEQRGTLLSNSGGSGNQAAVITLRFMALWAVWLVPLEILGLTPQRIIQSATSLAMGHGGGETVAPTVAVVLFMAACPPIFLIMSVGSPSFLETFLPARWGVMYRGRLMQLFLIYVIYVGAVGVVAVFGAPLVFAVTIRNALAGKIAGWVLAVFVSGMAIDLLGRLCGFFVLSKESGWDEVMAQETSSKPDEGPNLAPVVLPREAVPAPGTDGPAQLHKPELTDVREVVERIVSWFNRSPDRALNDLEALRVQYAPHPLVLHSLCLLYDQAGRREDSCRVAPEALTICMERDAKHLAADILMARFDQVHEFGLDTATLLALADTLRSQEKPAQAEAVCRMVLRQAPGDRSAIKGLLRVAEDCMGRGGDLERAKGIYAFLLEHAGDSPLGDFMRDGLAKVERKLAA